MSCPVHILTRLHRDLVQRARELTQVPAGERQARLRELSAWFRVHCLLEETILYPATLDLRADEVVEAELDDLDQQKRLLAELLDPGPAAPGRSFDSILQELRRRLERHVVSEERDFYPRVRRLLDAEQRQDLTLQLETLVERARQRFAGQVGGRAAAAGEPNAADTTAEDLDRLLDREGLPPPG
jgi:hypothetical protein